MQLLKAHSEQKSASQGFNPFEILRQNKSLSCEDVFNALCDIHSLINKEHNIDLANKAIMSYWPILVKDGFISRNTSWSEFFFLLKNRRKEDEQAYSFDHIDRINDILSSQKDVLLKQSINKYGNPQLSLSLETSNRINISFDISNGQLQHIVSDIHFLHSISLLTKEIEYHNRLIKTLRTFFVFPIDIDNNRIIVKKIKGENNLFM